MNPWLRLLISSLLVGGGAGLLYSLIFDNGKPAVSIIFGIVTYLLLFGFERQLLLARFQHRIQRFSAPVYGGLSILIYVTLIAIANVIAGSLVIVTGLLDEPFWDTVMPTARVTSYSLVVAAIVSFVLRMRDLIGGEMFLNLLIGRYHKPVQEERIFLLIDLVGSTSIAERMGPMRYQEFLGHFFASLAEPVRRYQGSLDDYIGDMAIITWPLDRGLREARCLRCVQSFIRILREEEDLWRKRFGVEPRFRAVLHCGPVVTAEIGVEKHKITYLGDTVNTASRLEEIGKALREPLLVSGDLIAKLSLPAESEIRDLGLHAIRGRDQPLSIMAVGTGSAGKRSASRA